MNKDLASCKGKPVAIRIITLLNSYTYVMMYDNDGHCVLDDGLLG